MSPLTMLRNSCKKSVSLRARLKLKQTPCSGKCFQRCKACRRAVVRLQNARIKCRTAAAVRTAAAIRTAAAVRTATAVRTTAAVRTAKMGSQVAQVFQMPRRTFTITSIHQRSATLLPKPRRTRNQSKNRRKWKNQSLTTQRSLLP